LICQQRQEQWLHLRRRHDYKSNKNFDTTKGGPTKSDTTKYVTVFIVYHYSAMNPNYMQSSEHRKNHYNSPYHYATKMNNLEEHHATRIGLSTDQAMAGSIRRKPLSELDRELMTGCGRIAEEGVRGDSNNSLSSGTESSL
jgi:hypothetical protein